MRHQVSWSLNGDRLALAACGNVVKEVARASARGLTQKAKFCHHLFRQKPTVDTQAILSSLILQLEPLSFLSRSVLVRRQLTLQPICAPSFAFSHSVQSAVEPVTIGARRQVAI